MIYQDHAAALAAARAALMAAQCARGRHQAVCPHRARKENA